MFPHAKRASWLSAWASDPLLWDRAPASSYHPSSLLEYSLAKSARPTRDQGSGLRHAIASPWSVTSNHCLGCLGWNASDFDEAKSCEFDHGLVQNDFSLKVHEWHWSKSETTWSPISIKCQQISAASTNLHSSAGNYFRAAQLSLKGHLSQHQFLGQTLRTSRSLVGKRMLIQVQKVPVIRID